MTTIPEWSFDLCESKSHLDRFVFANEPAGNKEAQEFRQALSLVIEECCAAQHARLRAEVEALRAFLSEAADYTRHPDYDWPVEFSRQVRAAIDSAKGGGNG